MPMTKEAREIRKHIADVLERIVGMKIVSGEQSLYERENIRVLLKCNAITKNRGADFHRYSFGISQTIYNDFLSDPKSHYVLFLIGNNSGIPETMYLVPADFITNENIKKDQATASGEYKFHIRMSFGLDSITSINGAIPGYLQEEDRSSKTNMSEYFGVSLDELPERLFPLIGEKGAIFDETQRPEDFTGVKRVRYDIYRPVRDTRLSRMVKRLNQFRCQICGYTIEFDSGRQPYAETHHIWPLGRPHNGPDTMNNIICVCPNHHAELDYGAIRLNRSMLNIDSGHVISDEYIDYHNTHVFGKY